MTKRLTGVAMGSLALLHAAAALADRPIQGMPVPELAVFDQLMDDFMTTNDIDGGLLGIMRNGVIVYQRGFGWKNSAHTIPLRHDALMRIASCTKPITAAATQRLIADDVIDNFEAVFEMGQPGGGLLDYAPFPGPAFGDARFDDIRVWNLYDHSGGWDRGATADLTYREVQIADDMGIASPPGRNATVRWILGQPLDFAPGSQRVYSNVGFMLLGLIIEQESGMSYLDYVRQNVFGPLDWCPVTEIVRGRTFSGSRDPREPWYDDTAMVQNVFDPDGDTVRRPDGGWDHEARIGQGNTVASTTIMLHLLENYYVNRGANWTTYGVPTNGVRDNRTHNGSMPGGTNSRIVQRADGVNYVVLFNKKGTDVSDDGDGDSYNTAIMELIDAELNGGGITWPTQGVDGRWVDFTNPSGDGSFEDPWSNMTSALANEANEGTLNLKAGSSNWTGVISQEVRIRAPLGGLARIGQ